MNFIDQLFFENRPWGRFAVFEYFSQNGCVTRVLEVGINRIFNVIEKGFEAGITVAFGGLFGSVSELGQKGKDLIRSDGIS
ncbi:MAG: hypothetical protein PVH37_04190 [Desulfobacterales bacterium]|jgi:hypothetical protein